MRVHRFIKEMKPSRINALFKRYGLTLSDYVEILESQDYRCPICNRSLYPCDREPHVDHNHDTGEIRGILCNRCNVGLGGFEDSVKLLTRAIVYLQDHGEDY